MDQNILLLNMEECSDFLKVINEYEFPILNIDSRYVCLKDIVLNNNICMIIFPLNHFDPKKLIEIKECLPAQLQVVVVADAYMNTHAMTALLNSTLNFKIVEVDKINMIRPLFSYQKSQEHQLVNGMNRIIGNSPLIVKAKDLACKAAKSDITVHLEGESGVGKELFSQAIHNTSRRRNKPFVAINCGAIPENIVESVLFGHEKGAFTGAYKSNSGKFLDADKGTIFLDEIGELKPEIQVKLLRVIQESEVVPIGSTETHKIDVRIISATNKNLEEEVKLGNFREDLFYRLNVFPIHIPSLQERKHDIELIARYYCMKYAQEEQKSIHDISSRGISLLKQYQWPGNIRELKNLIHRSIIMSESTDMLSEYDIQKLLHHKLFNPEKAEENIFDYSASQIAAYKHIIEYIDHKGEFIPLESIEQKLIKAAIDHYGGNMSKAAEKLQIGRSTLYRKLSAPDANLN